MRLNMRAKSRAISRVNECDAVLHSMQEYETISLSKEDYMLWTIFVILMILWLLGIISGYTIYGFIHILLVIAIVVVLIRIIQGRRPF